MSISIKNRDNIVKISNEGKMDNFEKYKNISYEVKHHCSVCGNTLRQSLISFPKLPLTEIYTPYQVNEKWGLVDQNFHFCPQCEHGQISNIISPEILYSSSYYFRTSTSVTASESNVFFLTFIQKNIGNRFFEKILEVGCNDLFLIKALENRSDQLIGIDPVLKGKEQLLSSKKIVLFGDLFEKIPVEKVGTLSNSLILSSHTIEHMENPKKFLETLFRISKDDCIFIFQFPGLETLIDNMRFDQIFHQHLQYFSLNSFIYLLNELGGELIDLTINPHHWGSLLVAFRKKIKNAKDTHKEAIKKNYEISNKKINEKFQKFTEIMAITQSEIGPEDNDVIFGYGAALMLPILSYHLKDDFSKFVAILDDDPSKENLYYLNMQVPIKNPKKIERFDNSTILITAIDNYSKIIPKAIELKPKKIILPLNIIS
jgi:SAM-dependent methyltransferase